MRERERKRERERERDMRARTKRKKKVVRSNKARTKEWADIDWNKRRITEENYRMIHLI